MKEETQKLNHLKGENPFRVPPGYMENLSSRIMSQLPDLPHRVPEKPTMMDQIRPWLYLAAVFVGLGLFINLLVGRGGSGQNTVADSLLVRTTISPEALFAIQAEEDIDYLEYIETHYVSYILAEEIDNFE
jgi:hypothetical protein